MFVCQSFSQLIDEKRRMYKRKFNADGVFADRSALRMVNAGGAKSTGLRLGTTRRYKSVPKAFKAMVNRAVSRTEEKKESNIYSLNSPLPPSNNAGWTASSICISPALSGFNIGQGVGQGQRIGNKIRVKRSWVKGIIHPSIFDPSVNLQPLPIQIRMIIFKDKFNRTSQPPAVALDLFQQGSSFLAPQNDLVDMILEFNRDRYQIYHDQVMKLGNADYSGTGAVPAFQEFTNNDFSYNCEFKVETTKFLPKTIDYNDASNSPMTDSLWMIFLPVWANGGQMPSNTQVCQMSWTAVLQYTDA